ncbi:MAG: hypothetical protein IJ306_03325 [Oscillospiraceae bacterium]|nr:hypothetical protein [Oscillospiraceae bacterium]
MKKFVALFFTLILMFSLCSCESGPSSEEIISAENIIETLDMVMSNHRNSNEDVITANTISASYGNSTKMNNLTSQLKYMSHDEFVDALANIVGLTAEDQGGNYDDVYEWCKGMDDPSDMFYIFNASYVPKACGMAIQLYTFIINGTQENLEQAKSALAEFEETYPDSEMLSALKEYYDSVEDYSNYCQTAFVISDSVKEEIEQLESICESTRDSVEKFIV